MSEKTPDFIWNEKRSRAALALARGLTQAEVAAEAEVTDRTIRNWLDQPEFSEEVDRLTLMTDVATRAERVRIAMRAVRQKVQGDTIQTEKDLLDWLRYVQSETSGVKLDLTAFLEDS